MTVSGPMAATLSSLLSARKATRSPVRGVRPSARRPSSAQRDSSACSGADPRSRVFRLGSWPQLHRRRALVRGSGRLGGASPAGRGDGGARRRASLVRGAVRAVEREDGRARVGRGNGSRLDADLLTGGEIELLMRHCSRRAPTGVRNRALIAVLWRCGLRIGEALALKAKDFDPDSGTLVVQRGKGGKRRVVGVDAGTVALVGRWLERAPEARHRRRARSSARSQGGRWTSRTSGTCSPGSRARRASSAGCTRTGSGTPSRSTSSARGAALRRPRRARPLVASRPRRCTSPASGRTRRSTRCGTASGRGAA